MHTIIIDEKATNLKESEELFMRVIEERKEKGEML